jgi:serine protease Do
MNGWRSRFLVAIFSSAALAGGFFGGAALLDRVEFARAESQVETDRAQLARVEDLSSVFREVNKVVEPSVVKIEVVKEVHVQHPDIDENLLRRFFRDNGQDMPDLNGGGDQQEYEQDGTGSGVIMETGDGYGYILTNDHVAGGASDIKITLSDGRVIEHGHLMGTDPKSDLAVVRIKADNLIAAHWGNSDELQQGDWILAFGSPLGYSGSMTHGIVSALNRSDIGIVDGGEGYENFIQVDAPINPGNSGGPLVNLHGEVVGINAAIASRTGLFSGIGFAIPSNQAHKMYASLKSGTKVVRGWLGISMNDVSDDLQGVHSLGYAKNTGVEVAEVGHDTPASGKLQINDIITAYNGAPVATKEDIRNAVAATEPGAQVKITVFRDGRYQDVSVTIGSQPEDLQAAMRGGTPGTDGAQAAPHLEQDSPTFGLMGIRTLTSDLVRQLNTDAGASYLDAGQSGALITNINAGSIADKAHLSRGDVITHVGRTEVTTSRQAKDALDKADAKAGVRIRVLTPEGPRFVFLQEEVDVPSNN